MSEYIHYAKKFPKKFTLLLILRGCIDYSKNPLCSPLVIQSFPTRPFWEANDERRSCKVTCCGYIGFKVEFCNFDMHAYKHNQFGNHVWNFRQLQMTTYWSSASHFTWQWFGHCVTEEHEIHNHMFVTFWHFKWWCSTIWPLVSHLEMATKYWFSPNEFSLHTWF